MGTVFIARLYCAERLCDSSFEAIVEVLARIDRLMSVYHASEITGINAVAGSKAYLQPVSPETRDVLVAAHEIARLSEGLFDPTVLPLLKAQRLFREDFPVEVSPAGREAVLAALSLVDYRELVIKDHLAGLRRKGMALDLGAIAKGYSLDLITKKLKELQISAFVLNFGGQLAVFGVSETTQIYDPLTPDRLLATCTLTSGSLSVSAQDKRFVTHAGKRRGHLLNPKTGESEDKTTLALVYHSSAMQADGWSTALFFSHGDEFRRLADGQKIAALHVTENNAPVLSAAMQKSQICRPAR
jgi:thiamine biosynthesis lipoprotein